MNRVGRLLQVLSKSFHWNIPNLVFSNRCGFSEAWKSQITLSLKLKVLMHLRKSAGRGCHKNL